MAYRFKLLKVKSFVYDVWSVDERGIFHCPTLGSGAYAPDWLVGPSPDLGSCLVRRRLPALPGRWLLPLIGKKMPPAGSRTAG